MVDDSKAFKLVGANHDPTPLVLAFHSSCGDSSATPLLPFSLSLSLSRSLGRFVYIRLPPLLALYLSKPFGQVGRIIAIVI